MWRRQTRSPEAEIRPQGCQEGRLMDRPFSGPVACIPVAVTGRPDRDDTAIVAVDAGADHGRKWPPEPTSRHAVRQGVRIRVFENSDPSEQVGMVRSDGADRRFHLFCEGCSAAKHGSLGPRFDPVQTTFLALGAYTKRGRPGQGPGAQQKYSGTKLTYF